MWRAVKRLLDSEISKSNPLVALADPAAVSRQLFKLSWKPAHWVELWVVGAGCGCYKSAYG